MTTIHQFEANRLNSKKSTGPRPAEGNAASSKNALKSGIDAKSLVIDGEKPADLEALTTEYFDRFQPATPEERFFVDILIRGDWQIRRLARVDAETWENEMSNANKLDEDSTLGHRFERGERTFERLQRRINATERSYQSALHTLQQFPSARDTQPGAKPVPVPHPAARRSQIN